MFKSFYWVAAAHASHSEVLVVEVAGLVAGEYVSVSSQAETEKADLLCKRKGLDLEASFERNKLDSICVGRGLDPLLAKQVADPMNRMQMQYP